MADPMGDPLQSPGRAPTPQAAALASLDAGSASLLCTRSAAAAGRSPTLQETCDPLTPRETVGLPSLLPLGTAPREGDVLGDSVWGDGVVFIVSVVAAALDGGVNLEKAVPLLPAHMLACRGTQPRLAVGWCSVRGGPARSRCEGAKTSGKVGEDEGMTGARVPDPESATMRRVMAEKLLFCFLAGGPPAEAGGGEE